MKKVAVIGHLDWSENHMIGAVVKARNILLQLQKQYGDGEVGSVDIYKWRQHKGDVLKGIIRTFAGYKNIVLVCSDTSVALMQLFRVLKSVFKNNILYCVVGGNMPELLEENPQQIKALSIVNSFFVETRDCIENMNRIGISNVELCRNFKSIEPVSEKELKLNLAKPVKFCTFSRVVEEKGITDAIKAVIQINEAAKDTICKLDIYGSIEPEYKNVFERLLKDNCYVTYMGTVDSEKSVQVLKDYYCMLFPTKFQTEGIPGTIIDAFAAGIPVICSNWKRCSQIVTDGIDGIVYPFGKYQGLVKSIKEAIEKPDYIETLKRGSLKSFNLYSAEVAIKPLVKAIK